MTTLPDLLRLFAIPVFGWIAWRDYRTRRVPARAWYPLAALGVVLLIWDAGRLYGTIELRLFLLRTALSLGIVIPLGVAFHRIGGFGGADAKAFMVLAVLFPVYPTYHIADISLPIAVPPLGVFSLTAITNGVLAGILYPLALAARNAIDGELAMRMFVARPVAWDDVGSRHGAMFVDTNASPRGYRDRLTALHPQKNRLDLDALRMYLRWRGTSIAELRAHPELKDPATLPDEPNPPTDGAVETDGGPPEDPWGAAAFLDDVGPAYGTEPAELRAGLNAIVTDQTVWVSPGIPFLVPIFVGLASGLIYGDVLFAVLAAIGLV